MKAEWIPIQGGKTILWRSPMADGYDAFIRVHVSDVELCDKQATPASWLDIFRDDVRSALSLLLVSDT